MLQRNVEDHLLSGHRMREFKVSGVQPEPSGMLSVEAVADDGGIQSAGMGTVDAQLMGTACQRIKNHFHGFLSGFAGESIFNL